MYRSVRLTSSRAAALHGTRRVLPRQGRTGEKAAFLSILQERALLLSQTCQPM